MEKKYLIILILLATILVLVACSTDEIIDTTNQPVTASPIATTEAPVETVKPTESAVELPTSELGKPQADSVVIFEDHFIDNEADPNVLFRFSNGHEIVEEQLYLSIFQGEPVELVDTYSPNEYFEAGNRVNQIEYHLTFKTSHPSAENSPWMGLFVGVRVYEPTGNDSRPSDADSGFYVSFNHKEKSLFLHGLTNQWPNGAVSVNHEKGFSEMSTICIVDTGNQIFYYTFDEETYTLFLRLDLSDEFIIVYNGQGEEIYKAQNNLKDDNGGYFKLFNHFGRTLVDSVVIKER